MKYLGYLTLLIAFYTGIAQWHPVIVLGCALASTFIHMSARRAEVRHKNYTGGKNMLADGAYLVTVQGLIMSTAYLLGWLIYRQWDNILTWLHLA